MKTVETKSPHRGSGGFKRREPFTFMLYLAMGGSIILFLGVLFMFWAKEYQTNNEVPIIVPKFFWWSTFFIILSSSTIFWSVKAMNEERFRSYRMNLIITFLLGIIFITFQIFGWRELFSKNIRIGNNTGGEFIFILSGLHIFHTIGGLIALAVANRDALKNISYTDAYVYSVNPPNQLKIKLISLYWHFVDLLWVALFLFFLYHASQNSGYSH